MSEHAESHHRRLPDFIIIGAQRGGTSSLFYYLSQHSQLRLPDTKEIHFFDNNYDKGINWYRSHFPKKTDSMNKKTGEASPYYLFHPHAAQRVYNDCPKTRLIVLLRNPVDRAYSHYMKQNRQKADPLLTFEEGIESEHTRIFEETKKLIADPEYKSINHQRLSYMARGKYYTQLTKWLKYFPLDQFLFIKSEDFYGNPLKELYRVHEFLGIKKEEPASLNPQNKFDYYPIKEKTRAYLNSYFEEENTKLVGLLGNNFSW